MKMNKTKVGLLIDSELHLQLKEIAKVNQRSLSKQVAFWIINAYQDINKKSFHQQGFRFTESQYSKLQHTLGLDRNDDSHRNYYNTGPACDPDLDDLVACGIMETWEADRELGGRYYKLTDVGKHCYKEAFGDFNKIC